LLEQALQAANSQKLDQLVENSSLLVICHASTIPAAYDQAQSPLDYEEGYLIRKS
jgi:hypothetical protein